MVIAFENQKGGVGKTTACLNVGAGIANSRGKKKVLLIDADPQGSLTDSAGVDEFDVTLYEVLKGERNIREAIIHTERKYDIIPSDMALSAADIELSQTPDWNQLFKKGLAEIREEYDYILIDCPPTFNTIVVQALIASDGIIIPIQSQYLALVGLANLMDMIDELKAAEKLSLEIFGIVATQHNPRLVSHRRVIDDIEEAFPGKLFETTISNSVVISEAPGLGEDVLKYAPKSKVAQEYKKLASEVVRRLNTYGKQKINTKKKSAD